MTYDYAVTSYGMFIRRITLDYLRYGYVRYVLRQIPDHRDPRRVDQTLIDCYTITQRRNERMRRRRCGLANVVFVRYERRIVLLATEGTHDIFDRLAWRDMRETPLQFDGYSIALRGGKASVRIDSWHWKRIKKRFRKLALRRKDDIERKLNTIPWRDFSGIVKQKQQLTQMINKKRRVAGLEKVRLTLPRYERYRERLQTKTIIKTAGK